MSTDVRSVPAGRLGAGGGVQQRRLLVVVTLLIAAFLVFFPTKQLIEQRARTQRLEARLTELTESNQELAAHVERLRDPEHLELLARERLGLVRPGERIYVFVPTPSPPVAAAVPDEPSILSKAWTWLSGLIRGGG